jgi:hypothetical protein
VPGAVVQVQGARELRSSMKRAGEDLQQLKEAHAKVAAQVAPVARSLAPHGTGRLAGSGRPGASQRAAILRFGSKAIPYAGVQEWGWGRRNIPAQPYATRAARQTEPTWTLTYQAAVDQILSRIKGD